MVGMVDSSMAGRGRGLVFRLFLVWFLSSLSLAVPVRADGLLLVHGYFSGVETWTEQGVIDTLATAGWRSGGQLVATPTGLKRLWRPGKRPEKGLYPVDLPSEAPIALQAKLLAEMMRAVAKRHADERLILVGHSAGGVVARLAMVQNAQPTVHTLITIASPHLGTDKAEMAGMLANSPLSMVTPFFSGADTLNRSGRLYSDLVRERPGSFLHWLNRQPHPQGRYVGIIRKESFAFAGDNTVPDWSQDLGRVAALQGRTEAVHSGGGHELNDGDGALILKILAGDSPGTGADGLRRGTGDN